MYQYSSKRNTVNNINNIESLAINYETPEDIIIAREENKEPEDHREEIISLVLDLGVLNELDIDVLMGFTSRKRAADRIGITYEAYKKRLQRKLIEISKIIREVLNEG